MAKKKTGIEAELDSARARKSGVPGYQPVYPVSETAPPAPPKTTGSGFELYGGAGKKAVDELIQSTHDSFKGLKKDGFKKSSPKRSPKR